MKKKVITLLCVLSAAWSLCGFDYADSTLQSAGTTLSYAVVEEETGTSQKLSESMDALTMEEQYELQILTLLNANRAAAGLGELVLDDSLMQAADVRQVEIEKLFSHTRPDGSSCFTAFPVNCMMFGENIAYGYPSAEAVMTGWMNSPGHYQNIMNAGYTKVGIGCFQAPNGQLYWVQCFGA